MRIAPFLTLACAGTLLLTSVRAATYTETGTGYNAHDLPGSAEAVPYVSTDLVASLDNLDGNVSYNAVTGLTEGDVYKIYISDPTAFSAATPVGGPNTNGFDTQLFLFNLDGTGIESNDNDPNGSGGASALAANPSATFQIGFYYLAITGSSLYPAVSTNGNAIFSDAEPTTTYGPTDASATFAGYTGSSTEGGAYDIALTGVLTSTPVPEPSSAAWLLAGVAGAGLVCFRRRNRRAASSLLLLSAALPLTGTIAADAGQPSKAAYVVSADGVPKNLGLGLESLVRARQNVLARHEILRAAGNPRNAAEVESDLAAVTSPYSLAQFDKKGRLLVNIYLDGTKPLTKISHRLKKHALRVVAEYDAYRSGVLSAWMPLDESIRTATMHGVRAVQLAPRPYFKAGLVTSQGTTVLHAAATGYTGVGSTIGALSDTFNLVTTAQNPELVIDTAQVDAVNDDLPGLGNTQGHTTPVDVLIDIAEGVPTDEGRGMLQIAHDMAPDAALAFATAEGTELVFANNIKALGAPNTLMVPVSNPSGGVTSRLGAGCNIICDDVGYLDEPMFSDGIVGQAIDFVALSYGVSYFSSAGNDANSGYSGTFTYVSPAQGATLAADPANFVDLSYSAGDPTGSTATGVDPALYAGGFHSFGTDGNGNPIIAQNVRTGSIAPTLVFQWDDPFDQSANAMIGEGNLDPIGITTDYNILVFDANGTYEPDLSGTSDNFSTNQPLEIPGTSLAVNTNYKIVLTRAAQPAGVTPMATHLRYAAPSDGGGFSGDFIGLDSVETYGHNNASNCAGVAAYVYDAIPNVNGDPNHVPTPLVESFSSNGPVEIYFDAAGNRLPTANLRRQPAFATVDGVDTSFFPATTGYVALPISEPDPVPPLPITPPVSPIIGGPNPNDYDGDSFPNFFGTSAAAPHAAACAALIIQAANEAGLATPTPRYIRSLLQATTQGLIDTMPSYCLAQGTDGTDAYTVSLLGTGDVSTDPNTFRITLAGPAASTYQLTSMFINLAPSELVFDTDTTTGFPFTQGDTGAAETGGATLSGATVTDATRTSATLTFASFAVGDALTFGVDRDVQGIDAYGNGVDQLQGSMFQATLTDSTNPANTIIVNGTFANDYNRLYNYKAGYGLVDVQAAINRMLGITVAP